MSKIKIPLIVREDECDRNIRMLLCVGFIIIVLILILYYSHSKSFHKDINKGDARAEYEFQEYDKTDQLIKLVDKPTLGRYVYIYNIHKKTIPINKIIIIDVNRSIIPITNKLEKPYNNGTSIIFDLGGMYNIKELILDVDKSSNSYNNILTTQVSIIDSAYNIIWNNNKQLKSNERFINLNIKYKELKHIPVDKQNKLSTYSDKSQECIMAENLLNNTWI